MSLLAAAVASALLLSSVTPLQAAVLFAFAAVGVCLGLWRQGWLGGERRLTSVSWLPDGRWLLADAGHASAPADLRADSRVGSRWLWLRWNADCPHRPRRRSLLLVRGDIPNPDLRRLVVRLRLEARLTGPLTGQAALSRRQQVHAEISGA
jgi:hypothetical protein